MIGSFLPAHPERVAGLIQLAGPLPDPWREANLAAQRAPRSASSRADSMNCLNFRGGSNIGVPSRGLGAEMVEIRTGGDDFHAPARAL